MKTIKELIEECHLVFSNDNLTEERGIRAENVTDEVNSFLKGKELKGNEFDYGIFIGYVEGSLEYQKELHHLKEQYDIKCDEKRKSDDEIARLTKIIMDAGLAEKLEEE